MSEDLQNILKIIHESFLRDEEKQILREQVEKDGSTEEFFATMNKFLITELYKRSNTYEKVAGGLEARYSFLEAEYKNKRQELNSHLEKHLSGIDIIDIIAKKKIFDQYYKDIDSIQKIYDKEVRESYSQFFALAIKETI